MQEAAEASTVLNDLTLEVPPDLPLPAVSP